MNRDFLHLYNDELRHIRERAAEFAVDYPEVARRLALHRDGSSACPDPFVERLLEGFAFLTARVQLKLQAEYPRFTQGILDTVYPDYMAPWPSAAIVRFTPAWADASLLKGGIVQRLTPLESAKIGDVSCTFRTAHELVLYPFDVAGATYHLTDIGALSLGLGRQPPAALRIRLTMKGPPDQRVEHVECERITFFLHGAGSPRLPSDLLENLFASTRGILITPPGNPDTSHRTWLESSALRHVGFEDNEAMLPSEPRSFEGHRILREHFLLPQRNAFFELAGLSAALRKVPGREVDIVFVLEKVKREPETPLPPELVQLYCTPAINLFPMNANRIPVAKGVSEYPVLINRTRTLDHEVYTIESVTGFRRTSTASRPFHPFYLPPAHAKDIAGFYSVYREARAYSECEKQAGLQSVQLNRQRTFTSKDAYRGSEVYLSLTGEGSSPAALADEVEELQVRALCTNRHLPLNLDIEAGFTARNMKHVKSIGLLAGPTPPRPSFAEGREAWRAVSHLSLNYLSLVDRSRPQDISGAEALRALLRLYAPDAGGAVARALVEGVREISSRPGLARAPGGGPIAFIRGVDISLTLEDSGYIGIGVFPLASALEQFFARYVSINHYTRLKLQTPDRGLVMEWPARVGRIPVC